MSLNEYLDKIEQIEAALAEREIEAGAERDAPIRMDLDAGERLVARFEFLEDEVRELRENLSRIRTASCTGPDRYQRLAEDAIEESKIRQAEFERGW
jgi:hypothetical protein